METMMWSGRKHTDKDVVGKWMMKTSMARIIIS